MRLLLIAATALIVSATPMLAQVPCGNTISAEMSLQIRYGEVVLDEFEHEGASWRFWQNPHSLTWSVTRTEGAKTCLHGHGQGEVAINLRDYALGESL